MPTRRGILGGSGERAAWEAYRSRGYRLIARNWRCRIGELDLIVTKGGTLVFCEVKTRVSADLGGPHESVTPTKQRKIRSLAEAFLASSRVAADRYRFDVASVTARPGRRPRVYLYEDAF
jgi:putative endonuclease